MTSGIMAFLHHLAAFALVGTIIYELVSFRKDMSLAEAPQTSTHGYDIRHLRRHPAGRRALARFQL